MDQQRKFEANSVFQSSNIYRSYPELQINNGQNKPNNTLSIHNFKQFTAMHSKSLDFLQMITQVTDKDQNDLEKQDKIPYSDLKNTDGDKLNGESSQISSKKNPSILQNNISKRKLQHIRKELENKVIGNHSFFMTTQNFLRNHLVQTNNSQDQVSKSSSSFKKIATSYYPQTSQDLCTIDSQSTKSQQQSTIKQGISSIRNDKQLKAGVSDSLSQSIKNLGIQSTSTQNQSINTSQENAEQKGNFRSRYIQEYQNFSNSMQSSKQLKDVYHGLQWDNSSRASSKTSLQSELSLKNNKINEDDQKSNLDVDKGTPRLLMKLNQSRQNRVFKDITQDPTLSKEKSDKIQLLLDMQNKAQNQEFAQEITQVDTSQENLKYIEAINQIDAILIGKQPNQSKKHRCKGSENQGQTPMHSQKSYNLSNPLPLQNSDCLNNVNQKQVEILHNGPQKQDGYVKPTKSFQNTTYQSISQKRQNNSAGGLFDHRGLENFWKLDNCQSLESLDLVESIITPNKTVSSNQEVSQGTRFQSSSQANTMLPDNTNVSTQGYQGIKIGQRSSNFGKDINQGFLMIQKDLQHNNHNLGGNKQTEQQQQPEYLANFLNSNSTHYKNQMVQPQSSDQVLQDAQSNMSTQYEQHGNQTQDMSNSDLSNKSEQYRNTSRFEFQQVSNSSKGMSQPDYNQDNQQTFKPYEQPQYNCTSIPSFSSQNISNNSQSYIVIPMTQQLPIGNQLPLSPPYQVDKPNTKILQLQEQIKCQPPLIPIYDQQDLQVKAISVQQIPFINGQQVPNTCVSSNMQQSVMNMQRLQSNSTQLSDQILSQCKDNSVLQQINSSQGDNSDQCKSADQQPIISNAIFPPNLSLFLPIQAKSEDQILQSRIPQQEKLQYLQGLTKSSLFQGKQDLVQNQEINQQQLVHSVPDLYQNSPTQVVQCLGMEQPFENSPTYLQPINQSQKIIGNDIQFCNTNSSSTQKVEQSTQTSRLSFRPEDTLNKIEENTPKLQNTKANFEQYQSNLKNKIDDDSNDIKPQELTQKAFKTDKRSKKLFSRIFGSKRDDKTNINHVKQISESSMQKDSNSTNKNSVDKQNLSEQCNINIRTQSTSSESNQAKLVNQHKLSRHKKIFKQNSTLGKKLSKSFSIRHLKKNKENFKKQQTMEQFNNNLPKNEQQLDQVNFKQNCKDGKDQSLNTQAQVQIQNNNYDRKNIMSKLIDFQKRQIQQANSLQKDSSNNNKLSSREDESTVNSKYTLSPVSIGKEELKRERNQQIKQNQNMSHMQHHDDDSVFSLLETQNNHLFKNQEVSTLQLLTQQIPEIQLIKKDSSGLSDEINQIQQDSQLTSSADLFQELYGKNINPNNQSLQEESKVVKPEGIGEDKKIDQWLMSSNQNFGFQSINVQECKQNNRNESQSDGKQGLQGQSLQINQRIRDPIANRERKNSQRKHKNTVKNRLRISQRLKSFLLKTKQRSHSYDAQQQQRQDFDKIQMVQRNSISSLQVNSPINEPQNKFLHTL